MTEIRKINKIIQSKATMEGAGVRLNRVFGFYEVPLLDPFLLLDDFGSANPNDYIAGFPWHPHRGIETVTYMLAGEVEHGDSLGNSGVIYSGDVQWMTAGSGIIHQELPKRFAGQMRGFQLWLNLPAKQKMMRPRYQEIKQEQIPKISLNPQVTVKIIAGVIGGVAGPVRDLVVATEYFDVEMAAPAELELPVPKDYKALAYVYDGSGIFDPVGQTVVGAGQLAVFSQGEMMQIRTTDQTMRFLVIAGQPLNEPIAWRGPIVMNTQEQLGQAFQEFRTGTFIKAG